VLPVIVFVAVAVPLLVAGFVVVRRRSATETGAVAETDAERRRTEEEFEAAERYQEQWREQHKHDLDHL
jgi:hypothetical protein